MVAQLVTKYATRLGPNARRSVVDKVAQIAQPQQWVQDYRLAANPQTSDFAPNGREASGFWLYNAWVDGRKYGLVQGFAPPSPNRGPTFNVKVVGGEKDGTYEVVDVGSGIYRPGGPFPVLAFANPTTAHGKIPLPERSRLNDQKLALTKAVVDEMVRREVNAAESTFAQLRGYREGQMPRENEIVAYARMLAARFSKSLNLRSFTREQLWTFFDCGTKFGNVEFAHRGIVLQRMVAEIESIWTGQTVTMMDWDMDPQPRSRSRVREPMAVDVEELAKKQGATVDLLKPAPDAVAPSATSWYTKLTGLGATTTSVLIALVILVLLLIFSR